jgi:hypothetical protein
MRKEKTNAEDAEFAENAEKRAGLNDQRYI